MYLSPFTPKRFIIKVYLRYKSLRTKIMEETTETQFWNRKQRTVRKTRK